MKRDLVGRLSLDEEGGWEASSLLERLSTSLSSLSTCAQLAAELWER